MEKEVSIICTWCNEELKVARIDGDLYSVEYEVYPCDCVPQKITDFIKKIANDDELRDIDLEAKELLEKHDL